MKREIKFRAWTGNGPMKYNVGVHPFMIFRLSSFEICDEGEYDDNSGNLIVSPDPYAVMQYTGLKDKNGKEIYEGDVLMESEHGVFEVVWDSKYCKFKLDWTRVSPAIQYPEWNRGVRMEVIGNIYENPELLKEAAY